MGLFGISKRNDNYQNQKSKPKCVYCEYGKPAKSKGMILCEKRGIVSENFSCKKFRYSPSKYAAINNSQLSDSTDSKDTFIEKTNISDSYKETKKDDIIEPVKMPETNSKQNCSENKKTFPESKVKILSDINFIVSDNSEKVKYLANSERINLSEINLHSADRKTILPKIKESCVSDISNNKVNKNHHKITSVQTPAISDFQSPKAIKRKLPENTLMRKLSDIK